MAKTTKKAKKTTKKERSDANKAKHARLRAREAAKKAEELAGSPKVDTYPQAGRKVKEFEEMLDQQLGDEAPGYQAPPGKEPQPETIKFDYAVIAQVCQIPFNLWSVSQGIDQLKLTDKEAKSMAMPIMNLLDYYLPQIPVIAWAWITVGVVAYSALESRLLLIQEIKKSRSIPVEPDAEAGGLSPNDVTSGRATPQGQGGPPTSVTTTQFPTIGQIEKEKQTVK